MTVKSIYLLNVVVKQESLIGTENKTGDIFSCCMQQSSIHYTSLCINSRTHWKKCWRTIIFNCMA